MPPQLFCKLLSYLGVLEPGLQIFLYVLVYKTCRFTKFVLFLNNCFFIFAFTFNAIFFYFSCIVIIWRMALDQLTIQFQMGGLANCWKVGRLVQIMSDFGPNSIKWKINVFSNNLLNTIHNNLKFIIICFIEPEICVFVCQCV